jgi:hypothetical protein
MKGLEPSTFCMARPMHRGLEGPGADKRRPDGRIGASLRLGASPGGALRLRTWLRRYALGATASSGTSRASASPPARPSATLAPRRDGRVVGRLRAQDPLTRVRRPQPSTGLDARSPGGSGRVHEPPRSRTRVRTMRALVEGCLTTSVMVGPEVLRSVSKARWEGIS